MAEPTIAEDKLCALTSLTGRRLRQLAKSGYFPPPKRGEYQLSATIKGMFTFYRELGQKKTRTDEDIKGERLRKLKIANDASTRDLIPADEIRRDFTRVFTELKIQLLTIPRRVAPSLAMESDTIAVEERIQKELFSVLDSVSNPHEKKQQ